MNLGPPLLTSISPPLWATFFFLGLNLTLYNSLQANLLSSSSWLSVPLHLSFAILGWKEVINESSGKSLGTYCLNSVLQSTLSNIDSPEVPLSLSSLREAILREERQLALRSASAALPPTPAASVSPPLLLPHLPRMPQPLIMLLKSLPLTPLPKAVLLVAIVLFAAWKHMPKRITSTNILISLLNGGVLVYPNPPMTRNATLM